MLGEATQARVRRLQCELLHTWPIPSSQAMTCAQLYAFSSPIQFQYEQNTGPVLVNGEESTWETH